MQLKKVLFFYILAISAFNAVSQNQDSIISRVLPDITVVGQKSLSDIHQLPEIIGTNIYAGKKSSLLVLDNVQGNVVTNTMRQVMAKVPGIFVWESEGSGIQINIASRGLSPNRSWEFNVRQNGYDIAADPYGYPEAYYNPQLQSVQRIEFVRGHGALQYGPQLGGLVNYILKNGSEFTKPFQVESFQTLGSNNLFNTYNAIGGKTNKVNYYAFIDHRQGEGWRENNEYSTDTGSGTITFKPNDRLHITAEVTRWSMLSQQPGGLTDAQFGEDARQSFRSRNWFNLTWQTIALNTDFQINDFQKLNVKVFSISGDRNSIGFNPSGGIVVDDTINSNTGQYNERIIDTDSYRNYGAEVRYINHYTIGSQESSLSAGLRLYNGTTDRYRGGKGSTGVKYDNQILPGEQWNAVIDYKSQNAAIFIENLFRVNNRFLVVPGIRYEYLKAEASGYSSITNGNPNYLQDQEKGRGFLVGGLGLEFQANQYTLLYANATQSYRPVQFADLTTPPTTDVVDPNLTDSKGLNVDIGYRGNVKDFLKFDVSVFHLQYNNRIGTIKQQREDDTFYNLRTNVGSSTSDGAEVFGELNITKSMGLDSKIGGISLYGSYAYNNARYQNFKVIAVVNNALQESNYKDKQVEYAPKNVVRSGITYDRKGFAATFQYSFTDLVYTDANNTEIPSANGQNGAVPAYSVMDLTLGYKHKSGISVKSGVNNLADARYFTRRAGGYPGPGLLPADGRTFFITIGYQMK